MTADGKICSSFLKRQEVKKEMGENLRLQFLFLPVEFQMAMRNSNSDVCQVERGVEVSSRECSGVLING